MSEIRKLAAQGSHYLLGRVAAMLLGLVSFPIFTRLMTVSDYGLLNLGQRVVLLSTGFGKAGLQHSLLRQYEEAKKLGEAPLERLISTVFFGTLFSLIAVSALQVAVLSSMKQLGLEADLFLVLMATLPLVAMRVLQSPLFLLLRMEERSWLFSALDVANRFLTLAIVLAVFVFTKPDPEIFLLGAGAAEGLVLAFTWVVLTRRDMIQWRFSDLTLLRDCLRYSLPMLGYEVAVVALTSVDRPLIQYFLGATPLGYYAASMSLATYAGDALQAPLTLALFPICMRLWSSQGEAATAGFLNRILLYYAAVSIAITGATWVNGEHLMVLLSDDKYRPAAPYLAPLLGCMMLHLAHSLVSIALLVRNQPTTLAKVIWAALLGKVAVMVWLMKPLGLWGAVIGTFLGYLLQFVWLWRLGRRCLPLSFPVRTAVVLTVAAFAAAVPVLLLPGYTPLASAARGFAFVLLYALLLAFLLPEFHKLAKIIKGAALRRLFST